MPRTTNAPAVETCSSPNLEKVGKHAIRQYSDRDHCFEVKKISGKLNEWTILLDFPDVHICPESARSHSSLDVQCSFNQLSLHLGKAQSSVSTAQAHESDGHLSVCSESGAMPNGPRKYCGFSMFFHSLGMILTIFSLLQSQSFLQKVLVLRCIALDA